MAVVFVWAKPTVAMPTITMGLTDVIAPMTGAAPINISVGYITIMDLYAAGPSVTIVAIGDPELPIEFATTLPAHAYNAATYTPADYAALQALLSGGTLVPGDIIELSTVGNYNGRVEIPADVQGTAGSEIIIRTAGWASLPAAGTRVEESDATYMATISGQGAGSGPTERRLELLASTDDSGGAQHIRFIGIEVTTTQTANLSSVHLVFGGKASGNSTVGMTVADVPHHIVFDRCLIHGAAGTYAETGVRIDGHSIGIVDSRIYEIHEDGGDGGSAWRTHNGGGPHKIQNCFLEASGIVVIIADQFDDYPFVAQPTDIVLRGNHITKDLTWAGVWRSKNGVELKYVNRFLMENNVVTNIYQQDQPRGNAMYVKSAGTNHDTRNATFRWNLAYNCDSAFSFNAADDLGALGSFDVLVENNLFYDIDTFGWWNNYTSAATQPMTRLTFRKNTLVINAGGYPRYPNLMASTSGSDWIIRDNIIDRASGPYWRRDGAQEGAASLDASCSGRYTYSHNVLTNANLTYHNTTAQSGSVASNNFSPPNQAAIVFTDAGANNYILAGGSPYIAASSTGGPIGCDVTTLNTKIAGVE